MQQQGFNDAYDKRLYDRLREGQARPVREHFHAGEERETCSILAIARPSALPPWLVASMLALIMASATQAADVPSRRT